MFLLMGLTMLAGMPVLVVVAFIALGMIQNTFRPAQITRFNRESSPEMGATILSVESQSNSLAAAALAPPLGWMVDRGVQAAELNVAGFWPVAALGAAISAMVLVFRLARK